MCLCDGLVRSGVTCVSFWLRLGCGHHCLYQTSKHQKCEQQNCWNTFRFFFFFFFHARLIIEQKKLNVFPVWNISNLAVPLQQLLPVWSHCCRVCVCLHTEPRWLAQTNTRPSVLPVGPDKHWHLQRSCCTNAGTHKWIIFWLLLVKIAFF